jgi:hypothetical protein
MNSCRVSHIMRDFRTTLLLTGLAIVCFGVPTRDAVAEDPAKPVNFTRDVRPILSNACFHCHGPDEEFREAELRLDQRDGLFEDRDGYVLVKPGDHSESELIRRILSEDSDEMMPPADSTKSLTEQQKQILVQWVQQGAEWQEHWSFVPPSRSALPDVSRPEWCRNEIDRFALWQMDRAGLAPSGEAAPYTLIRRLYLDLIGLPPTPQEADAWAEKIWRSEDADESAYQALVDHLLQSPHYGERAARRWLDLARYADTNGYEKDRERSIWPYRDWVINAINDGMPFDTFTIEQLAGDMLPNATRQQRVATGFHRNTMLNEEGGIDPLEFRFHAMTDRVATTGTTWLGLTLGCCQCHTHKYDPVSHREYYQIMAFLNNADEPSLQLPGESFDQKWSANRAKADQLTSKLADKWPVAASVPVDVQVVSTTADGGQTFQTRKDGFIEVDGENPERATYVVELDLATSEFDTLKLSTKAFRKQAGPGRTEHGNFVLSEIEVEVVHDSDSDGSSGSTKLPIKSATASAEQSGHVVTNAFDKDEATGWGIHDDKGVAKTADATFALDTSELSVQKTMPVQMPIRLRVTLKQLLGGQHTIAAFNLTATRSGTPDELQEARKQQLQAAFDQWKKDEAPNAVKWTPLRPTMATSNLPILTIQDDDSIFASGDTAKRDDYFITVAASAAPVTAIRLETLPDERLPASGPGSTYYEGTLGDFFLTEISATAGEASFFIASASHTYAKNRYGNNPVSAALAIDGDVQTGWSVHDRQGERHDAVFVFREPVPAGTSFTIRMTFGRHFASSLGRFRFSATDAQTQPQARSYSDDVFGLLARPDGNDNADEQELMRDAFLLNAPQLSSQTGQIRKLRGRPATTSTLVMAERPVEHPRPTHRHHRGEYLQPKESVQPGLPAALAGDHENLPATRLEFAEWIVSEKNPLTARVVVNRQWAAFFGTGIVKTVDDFGLQGEPPSHPELLDWLAVTFREDDAWSMRELHRRIVSSATYRQTAAVNSAAATVDPQNRLLSFAPRYRLDAEVIRDQLLVASGVLSDSIGGPSVRPPQPAGVTEVAYGGGKWNAAKGADRYRRSLYTYAKRTAPFAMLSTFDGPSGEACIARRNRSNSPLQALTLLNDVMLMDLARQAGSQVAADHEQSDADLTTTLFRRVLVRPPTDAELHSLLAFLTAQRQGFLSSPEAARQFLSLSDDIASDIEATVLADRAAWAATARALFGLDETLTRE